MGEFAQLTCNPSGEMPGGRLRLLVANLSGYSRFVTREFSFIMRMLVRTHGWQHLEPEDLTRHGLAWDEELERRFGQAPALVLFWEAPEFLCAHESQMRALRCPKWIFTDDLHNLNRLQARERAFLLCDTVLATYAYRMAEFFPNVAESRRVVWIPHSASPDFDLELNPAPRNELFLSGAVGAAYPMRSRLRELHESGFPGLSSQPHPGYHCDYEYATDVRIGPAYARRIWEHRAAFTDGTRYGYVVAKHFEIPTTGALLVADSANEAPLKDLGFLPGIHYFPVRSEELEDRVRYLFCPEHHAALDRIRANGQALVRDRHRSAHRAALIDQLAVEETG